MLIAEKTNCIKSHNLQIITKNANRGSFFMMTRNLELEGALLNKQELCGYLEKTASNTMATLGSTKSTYPVPRLMENYRTIKSVYNLLNENVKSNISIHPAGEWLLDNFYIVEEITKTIQKELTLKKYTSFVGIAKGKHKGFARIYLLASQIVNFSDNKITRELLEESLISYQTKKSLNMDEIWNIGLFMQIAIIENIRIISENIFLSQMEKLKVESIIERLVENKPKKDRKFDFIKGLNISNYDVKYPFVEYMSYKLKKFGKKTGQFLNILEEEVEKTGSTVSQIIKREHFEIAVNKISIGNSITSMKKIQRINFLEIFEKINGVEEVLNKDPAGVYKNMDYKTKEYYQNKIKQISKKTKISEMYIAKKILNLAQENKENDKKAHIGYYLQNENILYQKLGIKERKKLSNQKKTQIYISIIIILSIVVSYVITLSYPQITQKMWIKLFSFLVLLIPASEFVIQSMQYILSKIVKPKLIPKMNFEKGIPKEEATFVIIPTIVSDTKKIKETFRNLEVDYLSNKSENLYFCLLADCKESKKQVEEYDNEVETAGLEEVKRLNAKYLDPNFPKFHFIYRKRIWNESENSYLGWERKRGAITDFVECLRGTLYEQEIQRKFNINTIIDNKKNLPKIKYIITLDSDTELCLNSAYSLIGAMAHILNKPEIQNDKVIDGYGLIQPRVGINLDISLKNIFTKIFAGMGGIDSYSNAVSDIYQDNFSEGIFTGKGIFDLELYSKILKNEIPENTVLSHDLLEGSYLRCGLSSDILLMDGYPTNYLNFVTRLSRWIRGDWQIARWLKNKKLNTLSKFKIFDNLRRSILEISQIIAITYFTLVSNYLKKTALIPLIFLSLTIVIPYVIDILNNIILRQEGEQKQKTFTPKISGIMGAIYRAVITIGVLPNKAYISLVAIFKTLYRELISKKHLLEWMTSEETEKNSKTDIISYFRSMIFNVIFGIIIIIYSINIKNIFLIALGSIFTVFPGIMFYISKELKQKKPKDILNKEELNFIEDIGKRTFYFFYENLNEKNNYLIPDNYQEDRKNKYVDRTSSTNIGLSLLAVIAGVDLDYISIDEGNSLLIKILNVIKSLKKWNGHLYNWYNIKSLEPLVPRYISTVDSGNFVGYLYVVKTYFEEQKNYMNIVAEIDSLINETDFSKLYSKEHRLFSIGYNIEENKLTDSYYDLLASEARQASLVAIAKKDVETRHFQNLSRTLTVMNNKKGLISWSGTAFEYLMPNINIPRYKGSLIDESCEFAIMSQIKYAKILGTPWGISEAAFNVKDLHSNYQYKAFGIPWLGLKRGLADDVVISSYASILAITDRPKEVVKNLKELQNYGMYNKYGFYESIDFSSQRLKKENEDNLVKTYMAHHQALILLSINNLINENIFQKRFIKNPEVQAVSILLQERMPETFIVTNEEKKKPEKLKYQDYENYEVTELKNINENLIRSNVISNGNYTIAINQKGRGFSKYNDIYINRFKETCDYNQGIYIYLKNIYSKKVTKLAETNNLTSFMADQVWFENNEDFIRTKLKITIDSEEPVEIRSLELENLGSREEIIEITSLFEPILSKKEQDIAHPAFNSLFLISRFDEENNILEVKRKKRGKGEKDIYLETAFLTDAEVLLDNDYEIDKEKLDIRGNLSVPIAIQKSLPFSKKLGFTVSPEVALRKTIKLKAGQKARVNLVLSINTSREGAIENLLKYKNQENVEKAFEISKAKADTESRFLMLKSKDIVLYQKILGYIIFSNPVRSRQIRKLNLTNFSQSELWKYGISGDLKIILVKIRDINDNYVIKQVLKMYEFFRSKNIKIDLIFLDEENYSYDNYVKTEIESEIQDKHLEYLKNIKGGIFILSKNEMSKKDIDLLNFISSFTVDTHQGDLKHIISDLEEEYLDSIQNIPNEYKENMKQETEILKNNLSKNEGNKYYNEYGAFSPDGKEYIINVNKEKRLPTVWSNIMANEKFGTLVTENMGGYTWYKNSRLNRVSSWSNDAFLDAPSEIIYLEDLSNYKKWSLGLNPMPDENDYNIIYGFGYSKFLHESSGILQELEVFVPNEDSIKVNILKLTNKTIEKKHLKLVYYIKPVIGEDEVKSNGNLKLNFDENSNLVLAENLYEENFKSKVFISSSEKIQSFTGDKIFFLGSGGISNPDGLKKIRLNNSTGFGMQNCIAIQLEIEIESMSSKEIVLNLGTTDNIIDSKNLAYKYSKIQNCKKELDLSKKKWKETLEKIQVYTPIESTNIMLNGWALYQTITSRLFGRTGFYQSGGAYGFRDQLQDVLALRYIDPKLVKNQIIKHAKHQFIEGDVEHWWHDETSMGIRTRFSDDLLWLVYVLEEYIETTGDIDILDIEVPYLAGDVLKEGEEERYDLFKESGIKEKIYFHAIKAIEKSLNFGENNLPKIGAGDWNDGFSEVGNKGKGESVWLGFFMYNIIQRFLPLLRLKNDLELYDKYNGILAKLKQTLNTVGWDGRWYRRAFTDDGKILGSIENEECRIDSISQSWSVISNAGEEQKQQISMESLENHLVDKENGIIKLLDPPFNNGKLEPGYIKAYLPGVRENGGQYTHGAIWTIIAENLLGNGNKSQELYKMITPIEHSRTKETANKYKVEPYVIAADIYGESNLSGRGGWTWYTGSSSWYLKAGIEYILGLKIQNNILRLTPCIPKEWEEYQIKYKYGRTLYNITIKNPNGKTKGVTSFKINGEKVAQKEIKLTDDGKVYEIEIEM